MITLNPLQLSILLDETRKELVAMLMTENRDELTLISPAQAAGLLDVNPKTLTDLNIPRVVLVPNRIVKYRMADIRAHILANLER